MPIDLFKSSSALTNDSIVLITLFVLFATYGLYFGKGRIISLLLAFYPAAFLFQNFPYTSKLLFLHGAQPEAFNKFLIFLLFLVPLDIIIGRFIFSESGYGGSFHFVRVAGLALIGVILTLVMIYSVVNLDAFYNFSPTLDSLFVPTNIFWWLIGPFFLMLFM